MAKEMAKEMAKGVANEWRRKCLGTSAAAGGA